MKAGARRERQGQPVMALVLIVATWGGARVLVWQGGALPDGGRGVGADAFAAPAPVASMHKKAVHDPGVLALAAAAPVRRARLPQAPQGGAVPGPPVAQGPERLALLTIGFSLRDFNPAVAPPARRPLRALGDGPEPVPDRTAGPVKDDPRWSGDNWLLLRAGSGAAAQAPGAASYGASQAGAIVRYRLGRGDVPESYGYLRTSLAINAPGKDKEIAVGFGMRPLARLPVRVLAEARLQDTAASPMQVRPVATVISELPALALPLGFRAEAYAQAGYAGGRGATPFYDVQLAIDRALPVIGGRGRDVRLGAGAWSGGQEGAVRLDVGPRASFRLDLGDTNPARVAIDWRFRLAGNARPASGPALTIASSF
ncbi:MAG: hypothetical protein NTX28_14565 [Novosphingobium sp.]|nr:hypothetical protein [Novosphingobium sp.]